MGVVYMGVVVYASDMANYCEDYPCCGHTDGLGCNWTPPSYDTTVNPHALCDHENGDCDVDYDDEPCCDWQAEHEDEGSYHHDRDCENYDGADVTREQTTTPPDVWFMEDQWLDGSYEE